MHKLRLRIFAAIDFEQMRQLLDDICSLERFLFTASGDRELLLEMMEWLQPDAFIFDDRFVGSLITEIAERFTDTTLIALTSDPSRNCRRAMRELGIHSVHTHPFKLDPLLAELHAVEDAINLKQRDAAKPFDSDGPARSLRTASHSSRIRAVTAKAAKLLATSSHSAAEAISQQSHWRA